MRADSGPGRATSGRSSGGTRFRLFPVFAEDMPPETVEIPSVAGSIGPGPSDHALYVADAADKREPYDPPRDGPPYRGPLLPPALPDPDGHFDHLPVDTPQFLAAHQFGSMRYTLDIWEHYLGHRIEWWDSRVHPRTELIPFVDWPNAQSGPGFLETGLWQGVDGSVQPYALNFDVIAHETGHQILFSQLGVPGAEGVGAPFLAFHESFSDLVALIAVMHFPSVLNRLLEQTQGNLYVLNLVNRIAETSAHTQIRLAANTTTMDDVADIRLAADGSWIDPTGQGRNQHWIGAPLTGAIFDILVEIYQDALVVRGLIPNEANAQGWTREEVDTAFADLNVMFSAALTRFDEEFMCVIRDARDAVGRALAHVLMTVRPDVLSFAEVAARLLESMEVQGYGPLMSAMLAHFEWRGIDPAPFLHLRQVASPGRSRRQNASYRLQMTPHRACGSCCHPAGSLRAMEMIRAAHANGAPRREVNGSQQSAVSLDAAPATLSNLNEETHHVRSN
jgi:hypothetical protein